MPFRPVEFDGLTVTPYVDDKRNRVAYSFRATGMRAPQPGARHGRRHAATPGRRLDHIRAEGSSAATGLPS